MNQCFQAEEVLSTMRTVRSFACEDVESKRFYDKLTYTLSVTRQKAVAYIFFLWTSEVGSLRLKTHFGIFSYSKPLLTLQFCGMEAIWF
jgi:hypothetical protein